LPAIALRGGISPTHHQVLLLIQLPLSRNSNDGERHPALQTSFVFVREASIREVVGVLNTIDPTLNHGLVEDHSYGG
jgi:hypothetical protein